MAKIFLSPLFGAILVLMLGQFLLWCDFQRLGKNIKALLLVLTGTTFALCTLSLPVVANELAASLDSAHLSRTTNAESNDVDVMVVLGGGYWPGPSPGSGELSGESMKRVVCGVRRFQQSKARLLIFSGTDRPGETRIGSIMQHVGKDMGLSEEHMVIEPYSLNTRQHPEEVWSLPGIHATDRIGVVTSRIHMRRATREFSRYFQFVLPISCDISPDRKRDTVLQYLPQIDGLSLTTAALHEYIGYVWYWWLDLTSPRSTPERQGNNKDESTSFRLLNLAALVL